MYCEQVATSRLLARLIWALAEHFDLDGLDPLLADDPEDALNIIVANVHKVLFNGDSPLNVATNRLQDIQAVLLCSQHLGSRYPRAAQLLTKELEDFRASTFSDSVSKHQCRLILQIFKHTLKHPESRLVLPAHFFFHLFFKSISNLVCPHVTFKVFVLKYLFVNLLEGYKP